MAPPSSASLVAAVASLAVAAVVLARRQASPGTRSLLLFLGAVILWHLGDFLYAQTDDVRWAVVSAMGSAALVPPLVLFVRATLGAPRRRLVVALYACTGAALCVVALGFVDEPTRLLVRAWGWLAYLLGLLPPLVFALVALGRAARREKEARLRARARRLLLGIALGLFFGVFDAVSMAAPQVPRLGSLGTIAGSLALGWSLDADGGTGRALATRSALLVVALTASAALLTIAVSDLTQGRMEAVLVAGSGTALAALAAFRWGTARLQRDAMQVQSLALLGTFAAEVAHEVRNPLAAIRGAVQFLREEARREGMRDELVSYLQLVDDEVERLDAVVTDYHALARPTASRNQRVDVGKVVRDVVQLHGRVIPKGIEVKTEIAQALPAVRGDAGRLRQALLNLVRNAVDAMPGGGTLTLRARADPRQADRSVLVEVEDTGVGISRKNLEAIFKPGFTTTATGSGLGLAVTQRIAEEHSGTLLVRSHTGGGTTFILVLPAEPEGT